MHLYSDVRRDTLSRFFLFFGFKISLFIYPPNKEEIGAAFYGYYCVFFLVKLYFIKYYPKLLLINEH